MFDSKQDRSRRNGENLSEGQRHRTAAENRKYKSPERKLYDAVYNRLKTRHHQKKVSDDEWNKVVALAWEYKEKAERGELQFHELEEIYMKM